MSGQPKDRSAVEAEILARAGRDAEFRKSLTADPRATLIREFGINLPADVKLQVLEETASHRYLVLPPANEGKLTEAELASIAGGSEPYSATCTGGCV